MSRSIFISSGVTIAVMLAVGATADRRGDPGAANCDVVVTGTTAGGEAEPHWGGPALVVASLEEAQQAVRATLAAGIRNRLDDDIVVCLGPGAHTVLGAAPLAFNSSDSGSGAGKVIWRGTTNGLRSVVTGGVQLYGWKAATIGGGPAFAAPVPAGAAAQLTAIRQLWVGDTRANRVNVPVDVNCNIGCTTPAASKGIQCSPGDTHPPHQCPPTAPSCVGFENNVHWGHCEHCTCKSENALPVFTPWTNPGVGVGFTTSAPLPASWGEARAHTIELVWPIVVRNWIEPRCTVASVVGNNVTLASPCGLHLLARAGGALIPTPGRIEAVPPTTPLTKGEFYHDTVANTVFYQLAAGQTLAQLNSGDAWIASKEVLVSHAGTAGMRWEDVQFAHSTWLQPNSLDGFVDTQATVYACTPGTLGCNLGSTGEPMGAVRVSGSTDLSFDRCIFSHIGSPYALSVQGGSKRVLVASSTFEDLSGGFLKLGSVGTDNEKTDPAGWDEGFVVTENVARNQAVEYGGAPGYFGGFIAHSSISHNTVSEAGYSGFSQGWGWGSIHAPGYGNVTISYNRIFNVMQKMKDGGGIYVNGYTSDSLPVNVMRGNWVDHDEHVFAVYYLDNGASHWHVTQNVATNSSTQWAFFMTPGTGVPANAAHNNSVDHLWYQDELPPFNGCQKYGCDVDNATVFKVPAGQPLPPPALAIMAAAGAMPAHL